MKIFHSVYVCVCPSLFLSNKHAINDKENIFLKKNHEEGQLKKKRAEWERINGINEKE